MNVSISSNCIGCGACAAVCPATIISMENSSPILNGTTCIKCGHCEAICPTHALLNDCLPHEDIKELTKNPVLDCDSAEIFLRSRRSIRCFKEKPVSKEETEKLLNIGRYAPTGSNSQGVSYLVVSSKEVMESLKTLTLNYYKAKSVSLYQRFMNADRDILFRDAPMCIFALTKRDRVPNARYALTYIELFAPSMKLGTCWAGFLEGFTSKDTNELRNLLTLPDDLVVAGALLYGYPKYQYHRITDRDPLSMQWL